MENVKSKKSLLRCLKNTVSISELLGISKSTLYSLEKNKYTKRLIEHRVQLLAQAIIEDQVRDLKALQEMAQVLLDPFVFCKVPEDLEVPEKLPGIIPENVFGFLRREKVQQALRKGLAAPKEDFNEVTKKEIEND